MSAPEGTGPSAAYSECSREELIRRLGLLEDAISSRSVSPAILQRQSLIHDLQVHQVELDMQNREMRDVQQTLEESRNRYADLWDYAPVAYLTASLDGTIKEVNWQATKLLQTPRHRAVGSCLTAFLPQDEQLLVLKHLQSTAQSLSSRRQFFSFKVPRSAGRCISVEMISSATKGLRDDIIDIRCALIDISDRRQLEQRLRFLSAATLELSQTLDLRAVQATCADLAVPILGDIAFVDLVESNGNFASRGFVAMAKKTADKRSRDHAMSDRTQVQERLASTTMQARVIKSGEAILLDDLSRLADGYDWLTKDEVMNLRLTGAGSVLVVPLVARGRLLGAFSFLRLATSPRFSTEDIGIINEYAQRGAMALDNAHLHGVAQRSINARQSVLAIVSHDLRNPLSVICLNSERLAGADRELSVPATRRAAQAIYRCAQNMDRLIGDLLDTSSIEAGHFSVHCMPNEAGTIVREAIEDLKSKAIQAQVNIDAHIEELDIICDRVRTLQVINNLLSNAIKFTPRQGTVTVRVTALTDAALFNVTDTGPGLAVDAAQHVFERFWQAPQSAHLGAGLGLFISRGIVEASGGRIWVDASQAQQGGASFSFTLPLGQVERKHKTACARLKGACYLVVDDDEEVRQSLCEALCGLGHRAQGVGNGREALQFLRRNPATLGIFLDLDMPIMDGWAFLEAQKKEVALSHISVIIISGSRDVQERIRAAKARHCPKPVSLQVLNDLVGHCVGA